MAGSVNKAIVPRKFCEQCAAEISRRPNMSAKFWAERRFCSRQCNGEWVVNANNKARLLIPPKQCEECGVTFTKERRESSTQWARRTYCSNRCHLSSMKKKQERPAEERFWEYVNVGAQDECWLWTGIENSNGYGRFVYKNKHRLAHRFIYELRFGQIPRRMNVCHRCDNRKCVNPGHLWLGTQSDNIADAVSKGRLRAPNTRGDRNGNSVLTWAKVRTVREMHARGMRKIDIAKHFGVSAATVGYITNNMTWKEDRRA